MIKLKKRAVANLANNYAIDLDNLYHSPSTFSCEGVGKGVIPRDVFRGRGLSKAALEIYRTLLVIPSTVEELVSATGRHKKTVQRALKKMSGLVDRVTGEIVPMVEKNAKLWQALDVDFNHVAEILGTAGDSEKQRKRHAEERRLHNKKFDAGGRFKNGIHESSPLPRTHELIS